MREIKEALAKGVIDADIHDRLLKNLAHYAKVANIPPSYALTSMIPTCSDAEIDWFKGCRKHDSNGKGGAGLVYIGDFYPPVTERLMLLTGAFLRNFIDARIVAFKEVVDKHQNFYESPTVLIIPNFSTSKVGSGWDAQLIMGLFIRRLAAKKYTVLHTPSMDAISKDYGNSMVKFIDNHFTKFEE